MIDDSFMQRLKDYEPLSVPSAQPLALSAKEIVRRKQESTDDVVADPMKVALNVIDIVSNPELLTQTIKSSGEHLEDVAPQTSEDMQLAMSRALFFLASKAPKESPSAPGMPPLPPPRRDVLRFERYLRAVNDPTSILDDADEGTLSPESVEAVKHVYPKLYEMMQADLAGRVENMPKVPYKKKMQISALLGQDMTGTLNPQMAATAQSAYGSAAPADGEPKEQMPVYRAKGLGAAGRAGAETQAWREAQRGIGAWNRAGRRQ